VRDAPLRDSRSGSRSLCLYAGHMLCYHVLKLLQQQRLRLGPNWCQCSHLLFYGWCPLTVCSVPGLCLFGDVLWPCAVRWDTDQSDPCSWYATVDCCILSLLSDLRQLCRRQLLQHQFCTLQQCLLQHVLQLVLDCSRLYWYLPLRRLCRDYRWQYWQPCCHHNRNSRNDG